MEVREMEEKSKKVRLEKEMKEKMDEKEKEVIELGEVREMEEKSKKVRLEEEMKEKMDEKEREVIEFGKKISVLNLEWVKNGEELEKCKSEISLTKEVLSEAEKREKEMELEKEELMKKVEEGEKMIMELNGRTIKPKNGVRDTHDSVEGEFQWAVVDDGSVGAAAFVAATLFVCCFREWSYFTYLQVRRLELALLKRWLRKGLKPVDHSLVSDVTQFVQVPSDL